ncbi:MAG: dipeptidase PepE [Bacteroidales bacterium]|jgi:dipeptidase E|nr:dipeptidase PepE [Bacteroidales bacterium]
MRLLLISNSTNAGEAYLDYPKHEIKKFLGDKVKKVLFVPYAAVTFSFDDYQKKVQERFSELGYEVDSIHLYDHGKKKQALKDAEAIIVGGGNTFNLLKTIQQQDLIDTIRYECLKGTPFVGWSAGSNVACPTICTTNDMPIVEPESFHATNLVRFQINPHYLDANPDGHAGESREQRIEEYLVANPYTYVVGLREGTMLKIDKGEVELLGPRKARIFKHNEKPIELAAGDDFDFLFD